jgi:hypothetical protein
MKTMVHRSYERNREQVQPFNNTKDPSPVSYSIVTYISHRHERIPYQCHTTSSAHPHG